MFLDEGREVPCTVSSCVVELIADQSPEYFKDKDGITDIPRVLFFLGFNINQGRPWEHIQTYKGVMIRNPRMPSQVYETTVYNGRVRNEVDAVVDGVIKFKKNTPHYLQRAYIKNEVLTVSILPEAVLVDIGSIGSKLLYDEGMAALDKRVDPTKASRNIVRK